MKNAAMIIVSAIMGFLILGIVLTIGGSMNRRCEVETILPVSYTHLDVYKRQDRHG